MKVYKVLLSLLLATALSGCGKYDELVIHGVKDYRLRGIKDGVIYLSLIFDIDNPNRKNITINHIEFKAWLNNREFGKLRNSEKIKIESKTRKNYEVPIELVLRTPADAFKLIGAGKNLLNEITVEGYIKGGRFPVTKKISIPKQSLNDLMNSAQSKFAIKDTLSAEQSKAMP